MTRKTDLDHISSNFGSTKLPLSTRMRYSRTQCLSSSLILDTIEKCSQSKHIALQMKNTILNEWPRMIELKRSTKLLLLLDQRESVISPRHNHFSTECPRNKLIQIEMQLIDRPIEP